MNVKMKALAQDKRKGGAVVRYLQALNRAEAERTTLLKIKGIMLQVRSRQYDINEIISFHPMMKRVVICMADVRALQ